MTHLRFAHPLVGSVLALIMATASALSQEPPAGEAKPPLPAYFQGGDAQRWPDPTGEHSGQAVAPSADGQGDQPTQLTLPQVYDRVVHNSYAINMVWVLLAGFLVMFMQAGFAMVETGLCRAKNAAQVMSTNFMIYPLGCLAFWAYGFALGWGNWFNGPVPPGWWPTLGPGTSVLNSGIGINPIRDESGLPTGAYEYGLAGTTGFFRHFSLNATGCWA